MKERRTLSRRDGAGRPCGGAFRLAIALSLLCASSSGAQGPVDEEARAGGARRVIEEIVVTAQKTEQSLRDVPISITVLDAEFIRDTNITDFRDLSLYVPNFTIQNTGLFPDTRIRGFGTALSGSAAEQPVAMVIDGVAYGDLTYFISPLYDVQRVEVLRGPQGTLFGKNTTAGVINVTLNKPTDELTATAGIELGDLDRRRFEGAVGGPIVPGLLNVRLSGLSEQRDGLVRNTTSRVVPTAPPRTNGRERDGFRVQLAAPSVYGAGINLSYDYLDRVLPGTGWEFLSVPENVKPFFRFHDPGTDFTPNNHVGSTNEEERYAATIHTVTANLQYDIGRWGLDLVGGWSRSKVPGSSSDSDFTPADFTSFTNVDVRSQNSAEARVTSPELAGLLGLQSLFGFDLGRSSFTGGFFYTGRQIGPPSTLEIRINVPVAAQFVAFLRAPEEGVQPLENFIGPMVDAGPFGVLDTTGADPYEETKMFFTQDALSVAGFGQMDWHFADRLTLQYGMRATQETKDATFDRRFTRGSGAAFSALGQEEFQAARSRSEFAFTPKVVLLYDWRDEINFYGGFTRGFKAGGFNTQASRSDRGLEFGPESSDAWEVGSKMRLLGGAATLNLGLFWHTVEDFQQLALEPFPSVVTLVVNAGEARARGVEVDGQWLAAEWLTVFGNMAFSDSEYTDFPDGECPQDRGNSDGDDNPQCDQTGEPLFKTPKWVVTMSPMVRFPLRSLPFLSEVPVLSGIDLTGNVAVEYQDVHFLQRTSDPRTRQPSFFRLHGNLGLGNLAQGWQARLSVENLLDQDTAFTIRDTPLAGGVFSQLPDPPRLLFASLRWTF